MTLRLHPLAEREMTKAARWYRARSLTAPLNLLAELQATFERILREPQTFPFEDENHQRAVLPRFPYLIIFRVLTSEVILVVAVHHAKRKPNYWHRRKLN